MNELTKQTRAAWLNERRGGIGGSDIGAILGMSKWATPIDIWNAKLGNDKAESADAVERMHWGTVIEPVIREEYERRHGVKVATVDQILKDGVLFANIDGAVLADGVDEVEIDGHTLKGASKILEIKTANAFATRGGAWGEDGTDEVPMSYYAQVQWYMGITGVHQADVAVLIGGQDYREYHLSFDPQAFEQMKAIALKWWADHVVEGVQPDPVSEAECRALWSRPTPDKTIEASSDGLKAYERVKALDAQIKELEAAKDEARKALILEFKDAEVLMYEGNKLATFKAAKGRATVSWKEACQGLNPSKEYLETFTKTSEGSRVLHLV